MLNNTGQKEHFSEIKQTNNQPKTIYVILKQKGDCFAQSIYMNYVLPTSLSVHLTAHNSWLGLCGVARCLLQVQS